MPEQPQHEEEFPVYPGLWECGGCGDIVDTTHFYMDRATGEMRHCADEADRKRLADQCGWRWRDDYGTNERCRYGGFPHTHHRGYQVHWSEDRISGAIQPYDPATANTEAAT